MNLNHINLSVKDVPASSRFFQDYLNFKSADSRPNDSLSVLTNDEGFVLVLMHERMNENGNNGYPDAFHIGFYLGNEEEVKDLYKKLQEGGISVGEQPKQIRRTFGFYIYHQDILIEIACQMNQ